MTKQFGSHFTTMALLGIAAALPCHAFAQAQACPADLSALDPVIQTESLRVGLKKPLAEIVQKEGGLEAALSSAEARLSRLRERKSNLSASTNEDAKRALNEAIMILEAEISALNCLKSR